LFSSYSTEKLSAYLNKKFQNLQKLRQQMTELKPNDRPHCKGILEGKIECGLEPSHLKYNPIVVNAEKCFEMVLLENYFITRFIKLKLKNSKEDFGNPKISSETFIEPNVT
jgi:hypothetical protein